MSMRLKELLAYDNIVVQCHDNPDADAIASGFGIYNYLINHGKKTRLVYGGKFPISKTNLILMVAELNIPVEHVKELDEAELLITVDCQYGEGNVTKFPAKAVAVIDHHQVSGELPMLSEVRSNLGSCATVVRELLREEGIDLNENKRIATALYYGLMTDTNNFTEIYHPLDKDLRDDAIFERTMLTRFRNSNLSLEELEIAGAALLGYSYNEENRFAVVEAQPCDPNILGIISDMMLEVDTVDTCLVYSVLPFGIKISVRSCIKEVKASEMAEFVTEGIGSGGGHLEKAGGFIKTELLQKRLQREDVVPEISTFFKQRMNDYFKNVQIIYAKEYTADLSAMILCKKRNIPVGFVKAKDVFVPGTMVSIRTLEGDLDVEIMEDTYIMIGIKGEVYPIQRHKFESTYQVLETPYVFEGEYAPTVKNIAEGQSYSIVPYASSCVATGDSFIYAKLLDYRVKVFTQWDEAKYMFGKAGDYLAVRMDDLHDVYVIERKIFEKTYQRCEEHMQEQ